MLSQINGLFYNKFRDKPYIIKYLLNNEQEFHCNSKPKFKLEQIEYLINMVKISHENHKELFYFIF